MTLTRVFRWLALVLAAGAAWIGLSAPAQAIPVFARQTGHNCQACHISFPELTAYGREFKLNGYTFGEAQPIPLAFAVMASYAHISDNPTTSSGKVCPYCDEGYINQASLFFGGKIAENLGVFGQYSISHNGAGTWSGAEDNTEIRYVHRFATGGATLEDDTVVGLDLNNNLTMQDVWNAVPQWRYPWFPQSNGGYGPVAAPFIDGAGGPGQTAPQRSIGIGAYIWYQKNWYAELSLYKKPWGSFSWLVNGSGNGYSAVSQPSDNLDGYNPYYRLAYSRDYGYSSAEVGIFGIEAKTYWDANYWAPLGAPGDTTTPGNAVSKFHDIGIDAQYQFNKNEPWIFSGAASLIHEKTNAAPLQLNGIASNRSNTLNEFNIKGTWYYHRQYGITAGYTALTGSSDPILYQQSKLGGSASGSPNSNFWDFELNYLPLQNVRLTLSYTVYTKLNGGGGNFDGLGSNATGQNLIYGALWTAW